MRTQLGKIQKVAFGHGGYQDVQIGIRFQLGGESWGVGDFWGDWALTRSEHAKWTEADRITRLGETVMRINELLAQAKVETVEELKGTPIECTFDGVLLQSWRVLTEVV